MSGLGLVNIIALFIIEKLGFCLYSNYVKVVLNFALLNWLLFSDFLMHLIAFIYRAVVRAGASGVRCPLRFGNGCQAPILIRTKITKFALVE